VSIADTPPSDLAPKRAVAMNAAQPPAGSVMTAPGVRPETTAGTVVPLRVTIARDVQLEMTVVTVVPHRVMSVAQPLVGSVTTAATVVPLRVTIARDVQLEMTVVTVVPLRVMSVAQPLVGSVTTADTAVQAQAPVRADDPHARVATHTPAMVPPAPAPAAPLTAPTGGQKQSRVAPSDPHVRTTAAPAPSIAMRALRARLTAMTAPRERSTVTLGRLVMRARPVMTVPRGRLIAMRALRARSIVMRAQRDRSTDQIAPRERLTAMGVMGVLTATSVPCAVSRASTRAVMPRLARSTTLCSIASRPMLCRLPMLRA
jgi:hypothetical protein